MHSLLPTGLRNTLLAAAITALPCSAFALPNGVEHSLMQGRIDEVVATLKSHLASNPADGPAYLLLCRAYFAEDHASEAVDACQSAVDHGLANDSRAQDWLGRAAGRKADSAGPISGLKLAHRVRDAFEAAVRLDPSNVDAVDDLADFYLQAPSIVGGGIDKARALAERENGPLPERAQRIRALIAEKDKDYGTAERELTSIANHHPDRPENWNDLASYYMRRKDTAKAVAAIHRSISVNHKHDPSLLQSASLLHELHQEPRLAQDALRSYLAGNGLQDDGPAPRAHFLLGQLLATEGNKTAAQAEYKAALALAANYAPARKALQAQ